MSTPLNIVLAISFLLLSSCSSVAPLYLRNVDFLTPTVRDQSLAAHFGINLNNRPTALQVYEGTAATPVYPLKIANDEALTGTGFLEAAVTPMPYLEIYYLDQGLGLKWQVLQESPWVSAIKVGRLKVNYGSSNSYGQEVHYAVGGEEVGISGGYQSERFIPYISYVRKFYTAASNNKNSSRIDRGVHSSTGIGIEWLIGPEKQVRPSLLLEVANTEINWEGLANSDTNWGASFRLYF